MRSGVLSLTCRIKCVLVKLCLVLFGEEFPGTGCAFKRSVQNWPFRVLIDEGTLYSSTDTQQRNGSLLG